MENKEIATTGLKIGLVIVGIGATVALISIPLFSNDSLWGFLPLVAGLLTAIAGVFIIGATNGSFRYYLNRDR